MKSKITNEIEKLKNPDDIYPFLLSLYLLFKLEDIPVTFIEFSAMSGYPLRFLYRPGFADLFRCSKDFIVRNLHTFSETEILSVEYPEVCVEEKPFVIKEKDTLIFKEGNDTYSFSDGEITKNTLQVEGTAYAIKTAEKPNRKDFYSAEKFVLFSKLLRKEFFADSVEICGETVFSGLTAFEKFAADLKAAKLPPEDLYGALTSFRIQTSLSYSIPVYLLGLHHFVRRELQNKVGSAIRAFEDFSMYIKECERIIGRNANLAPLDLRRIANSVKKAVSSYKKGTEELYEVELKIS